MTTRDGAQLALRRYASFLATRGVDAWVLDFRGHGESTAPRAGWSFDDLVEYDLPAAIDAIARASACTPRELAYVGHSLGGLAGLAAFGTSETLAPRRLVLFAVNVWTRPRGRRRLASAAFVQTARLAGHVPARTFRIGTDDEPLEYVQQFATWARFGFCARDGRDYRAALTRLRTPVLALTGDGDWMCSADDTRELLAFLPAPLRLRRVGRARGDALDPDHFGLLTDAALEGVWADTADFLASA